MSVDYRNARHFVWGALTLVAVEGVVIYLIGVQVSIPPSSSKSVAAISQMVVKQALRQNRSIYQKKIDRQINDQIRHVVSQTHVDIVGSPIFLPKTMQISLAHVMDKWLASRASQLLTSTQRSRVLTPQLIHQLLREKASAVVWVRVWGIPMPVTLRQP